jgi:hypothetical protein
MITIILINQALTGSRRFLLADAFHPLLDAQG